MKQIVILSPAHPLRGGIATSSERLAHELQKNGHQVVIFSFSLQYPKFLFPGKTQFTNDPKPKGLKIHTIVNSIWPLNWLKVGLRLRKLKPDLIITRYWLPFMGPCQGTILHLARSNKKTKAIAIVDNAIPHEKRPGDTWFTRYFINSCDGFIVMSKSVGTDIQTFTETKPIIFNPHPLYDNYGKKVDRKEAIQYLKLDAPKKYILFFGFIRDYKGLDLLLKAMTDRQIRELDIHLIIAGEYYGKKEYYENLIQELELEGNIIAHTEFIPNQAVKYYFGAADLVVQPYRTATQSGISQIAYHFDKPMVVTKVGGLPEIVPNGKTGYVVDVDASSIATAIFNFYQGNKSEEFTENIVHRKHIFSWEHMIKKVEELYQKVSK